jgi:transglutaminase-like putative cysteine protease
MILDVSHRTLYRYTSPVVQSQHLIHLSPRTTEQQVIRHHSLLIEPAPAARYDGVDPFGNHMAILDIDMPHREFVLHARTTVETIAPPAVDFSATTPWDELDQTLRFGEGAVPIDVVQYRCPSRLTSASLAIADYAALSFPGGRPVMDGAMDFTNRIYDEFTFDSTATDVSTPIHEVFSHRRGVCQDFAHFALAGLRALRIPARYVSGYILTRPPPGMPRLQGADASHAWVSVWSPETGWRDFDPTNGIAVSDEHVIVACGRDYDDVSPISGLLLGGGGHSVTVGVDVVPA